MRDILTHMYGRWSYGYIIYTQPVKMVEIQPHAIPGSWRGQLEEQPDLVERAFLFEGLFERLLRDHAVPRVDRFSVEDGEPLKGRDIFGTIHHIFGWHYSKL